MMTPHAATIQPTPDDDEAAAIVAALAAHLAAAQRPATTPEPRPSAWALAGRLESHGGASARAREGAITWGSVSRR